MVFAGSLLVLSAAAAAWEVWLATEALAQWRALGAVTRVLGVALGLGALAAMLPALAVRGVGRFAARCSRAGETPFFARPVYYRLVAVSTFGLLLAVVFGARSQIAYRLAAHLLGALALHGLLLQAPGLLQVLVDAMDRVRALRWLDLALFNAMAILVVAELALRAAFVITGSNELDPTSLEPFRSRGPIFGFEPSSRGFNDDEFPPEPGAALRVTAIGDSFFVSHVPRPWGLLPTTERRLAELRADDGPDAAVEILNLGMNATNPHDYARVLDQEALPLRPDALLVGVYVGNDIQMPRSVHAYELRGTALYRLIDALSQRHRALAATRRGEFVDLTRITRTDRAFWFSPDAVPAVTTREHYLRKVAGYLEDCCPPDAKTAREWRATLGALARMADRASERGLPMLLVMEPAHAQLSAALREEVARVHGVAVDPGDLDYAQQRLATFCREVDIACLDLLPLLRAEDVDPDLLYLRNDPHWSALGNELAAGHLARWLDATLPRGASATSPDR